MLMLALDTSTLHLSLALVEREGATSRVLASAHHGPPEKQSELLPGALHALLQSAGRTLAQVDALAMGMGPGSFTGLRVGLATLKALAFTRELRIGRASSLAALALEGPEGVPIFACALARQGELYVGAFERRGETVTPLAPEDVDTPEQLAEKLKAQPAARVLGPGLDSTQGRLRELGVAPEQLLELPRFPSAVAVATLAELPEQFDLEALFALEPHYLRASEPERNPKFPPLPGPPPSARLKDDPQDG